MYFFTIVLFCLLALAQAVPIVKRIVISPQITTPNASTIWNVGNTVTVTWDTSEIPSGGNFTGQLLLGNQTGNSENLDVDHPLAIGFSLSTGSVDITVPDVPSGTHYIVILFGDSGNASPQFTITGSNGGSVSSSISSSNAAGVVIPTPPITVLPYPSSYTSLPTPAPSVTSTATTNPSSSIIATSPNSSATSSTSTPATRSSSSAVAASSASGSPSASRSNGALPVAHAHNAGALSLCAAAAVLSLVIVL